MPTDAPADLQPFDDGGEARRWNHHPGEVQVNPLYSWPPRPGSVLAWYKGAWLEVTSLTVCFVVAIISYALFFPPLEAMQVIEPWWVLRLWLLSVVPQILVAGSLHWFLYIRRGQGTATKYEKRDLGRDSPHFTFNNQVWDNIWWTLGSAMTVSTVYQVPIFWAMANGFVPTVTFADTPVWFCLWMLMIPIFSSLHFYWTHRLAHHPKLFKHVHAVHHRNVNIGPWSGISNHWFENILYFSGYFIHLIVPSHPLHVTFHLYFQQVSPTFSHAGFEKLRAGDTDVARSGDFFHQLHHKYFECNYGTSEIPFDRWFGTFHNGSAQATRETKRYKKRMYHGSRNAGPEESGG